MQHAINYEPRDVRCTYCGGIFQDRVLFDSHSCNAVLDAIRKKKDTMQIPLELQTAFKNPGGTTLKLEKQRGVVLEDAVRQAYTYINSKGCPHTRIEFKFDQCYIVVAKLKDKEME